MLSTKYKYERRIIVHTYSVRLVYVHYHPPPPRPLPRCSPPVCQEQNVLKNRWITGRAQALPSPAMWSLECSLQRFCGAPPCVSPVCSCVRGAGDVHKVGLAEGKQMETCSHQEIYLRKATSSVLQPFLSLPIVVSLCACSQSLCSHRDWVDPGLIHPSESCSMMADLAHDKHPPRRRSSPMIQDRPTARETKLRDSPPETPATRPPWRICNFGKGVIGASKTCSLWSIQRLGTLDVQ